ncbi:MAG TPA: GTP 3',8-cyclase MoaA [Solirubrobacteraceae bacterium]|jgi:cyclic pyranopterin phosphate synthase|nr:GTP 3',8-cyclase MoaA [Solirubrobacteraceae bacterium]
MSATRKQGSVTQDSFGRRLSDLRISVTDRCNFRCTYCMPREVFGPDFAFLPRTELLSYEEITRLVRLFAAEGVTKVRLTGGEPLLRRNLEGLVEMLASIEGITDIALTTNGSLLARRASVLAEAGLSRVTVSLDALDDETFTAMNGVRVKVATVLDGIETAASAGLGPVKVNMVVKRGVNDHAVVEMAAHFRAAGHTLRFIEYMDVGNTNNWKLDEVLSSAEILGMLQEHWPLEPVEPNYPGEVASRYRYLDGAGEIGLISSVTQPFCGGCTRARLSADGQLYTCLFTGRGHDLRAPLRGGVSDIELGAAIRGIWTARSDRYSEARSARRGDEPKVEMSYIGG